MSGDVNRTDCAFVDAWLDDWLAGRAVEQVVRRIDQHIAACDRCRQLAAIVAGEETGEDDAREDNGLVSAVLGQTIGSPCDRAETQLPALVDAELDADSREILGAHVAHCERCSRLLAALGEAKQVLPALAEIEPPLGFTQRVLRQTTAAPKPLGAAFWEGMLRILARPRASLELGYVGAVLLVVLLGNPVAAFYQAGQRATQLAGAVPVAHLSQELGVKDAAAGTVARVFAVVGSAMTAVQTEVATRLNQARALLQGIETAVADAIAWVANIDVKKMLGAARPRQPRGQPAAAEPGARR